MEYTTLRDVIKPKRIPPSRPTHTPRKPLNRCPSGFRWDSKKGKCVQAGVGPQYKP